MPSTFDKWLDEITEHLQKKEQRLKPAQTAPLPPPPPNYQQCPLCDGQIHYCETEDIFECGTCRGFFSEAQLRSIY